MDIDKIYLLDTFVVGRQYYEADDVWRYLDVGKRLELVREQDNRHDQFAVALMFRLDGRDYKLGYLPRTSNEMVAVMLTMGWNDAFECVISRLDGSAPYDRQIGITLKVCRNSSLTGSDDAS